MKNATIAFLWIAFVLAVFSVCNTVYGFTQLDYTTSDSQALSNSTDAISIVVGLFTMVFAVRTIGIVRNAKTVSDIPRWRKILPLFLNVAGIVAGILMLCMKDSHLVAPVAPAPVAVQTTPSNNYAQLVKYKKMLDEGLITEEEYNEQKSKLLK